MLNEDNHNSCEEYNEYQNFKKNKKLLNDAPPTP